jgi:hypothetical protein
MPACRFMFMAQSARQTRLTTRLVASQQNCVKMPSNARAAGLRGDRRPVCGRAAAH